MTLDILYVQPGFGERGGVTVDVANLVEGLRSRRHRARTAGSLRQLRRELLAPGTSLVHIFGCLPSATTMAAFALARLRHVPIVWTPIFNPIRRHTWAGYGPLRVMELFDAVAPRAACLADGVIAATDPEGEFFSQRGARRVALIPSGVEAAGDPVSANETERFRRDFGIGPEPLVLIVGRDNSRKGLGFGLGAFAQLRAVLPTACLLLVGPDRAGGGGGVSSAGWLEAESLSVAYQSADVLFVPSLYEQQPRVVMEAWRWRRPVVVTDRVGLAATVDGAGGLVVPYGVPEAAAQALFDVLTNATLARRFGEYGHRLVESTFLLPGIVDRTVDLYEEVLADVA